MSRNPALTLLCIDDEREVLDALLRDLRPLAAAFRLEGADSADDARPMVQDILAEGGQIALVFADHLMPGTTGVEFLIELHHQPATAATRKVLVTAQAGHQDTIQAINEAELDHYISKPWKPEELLAVARRQLVDYLLANVEDLLPYLKVLPSPRLLDAVRRRGLRED